MGTIWYVFMKFSQLEICPNNKPSKKKKEKKLSEKKKALHRQLEILTDLTGLQTAELMHLLYDAPPARMGTGPFEQFTRKLQAILQLITGSRHG